MRRILMKIFKSLFGLYLLSVFVIFTPYFNWQYAKKNGFFDWFLFGEIIATGKALVWPYFLSSSTSTISESAASHLKKAIDYSNLATEINNRGKPYQRMPQQDLDKVIEYYKKSIEEAKQADIASMNRYFPGFGDHFQQEFIKGTELFLQGYESIDNRRYRK